MLIQRFERDDAIRTVHTKSQLARKPGSVPGPSRSGATSFPMAAATIRWPNWRRLLR